VIEDLFYNIPTRKKALRNFNEEYNRILDVVQRYAIEFQGVLFNCKKYGSPRSDVVVICRINLRLKLTHPG
jgi:DNA mismatch repair protein MLH1